MTKKSPIRRLIVIVYVIALIPVTMIVLGSLLSAGDWRTASRESTGIAPDPATTIDAVIQVYAARAYNWRGIFGVHSWIATKRQGADHYKVHQVVGWRVRGGLPAVVSAPDIPDRQWFGKPPVLLANIRGPQAEALIDDIEAAVESYPYKDEYQVWPGPNSNTFTAYVARQVPGMELELPVTAIGKDYLANGDLLEPAPSGTGYQVSLFGLFGLLIAEQEGIEINILGLNFGIDPEDMALKLPLIGNIGLADEEG